MTVGPRDPGYLDEAEVRGALTVAFDACNACRACTQMCDVFPRMFSLLDRAPGAGAGSLTPAEQDHVADACLHCGRCATGCAGPADDDVDIPRLMLRAVAMRRATGQQPIAQRVATRVLTHTHGTASAPAGARPGSLRRALLSRAAGVSPVRLIPPRAGERFSTWLARRPARPPGDDVGSGVGSDRRVVLVPTCRVEYHAPGIGRDTVRIYERNGVACSVADVRCCGAPWLHAGEVDRFARNADGNVALLAAAARAGDDLVVLDPTCRSVIERYPEYVSPGCVADAELVATRVRDVTDHLVALHAAGRSDAPPGASDPPVTPIGPVVYHRACPRRVGGDDATTLLALAGADVEIVDACAGTAAWWGLRSPNAAIAVEMADRVVAEIARRDGGRGRPVVSECALAAAAIAERGGPVASHPVSLLARAYGIAE